MGLLSLLGGGGGGFSVSPSSGADAGESGGDFFNNAGLIVGDGNEQGGLTAPSDLSTASAGSGLGVNLNSVVLVGALLILGLVAIKTLGKK